LGKSTFENLEGRHIQIFLHDSEAARAISALGWSGEVATPSCQNSNCAGILAGLVEANVGVNKANYFVARTVSFNSFVGKEAVENTMTVEFKITPRPLSGVGQIQKLCQSNHERRAKVKQVGIIESGEPNGCYRDGNCIGKGGNRNLG